MVVLVSRIGLTCQPAVIPCGCFTPFMTAAADDGGHRPEGPPGWLVEEIRTNLNAVDDQWILWEGVVGDRSKLDGVRDWLNEEERRGEQAGRRRIAEAPTLHGRRKRSPSPTRLSLLAR